MAYPSAVRLLGVQPAASGWTTRGFHDRMITEDRAGAIERRWPRTRLGRALYGRWMIAAAGTTMMMCLGTVYSWSLVARPLVAAFHWSVTTTMWTFAVAIFTLGLGAVLGGRW